MSKLLDECYETIEAELRAAGESAVKYNIEHGDYKNHTGKLRRSNFYKVKKSGDIPIALTIGNRAEYASNVESKGYSVVTGGVLHAEQILK